MHNPKLPNIQMVLLPTVYLDDKFIYSCSIEEHEKHLGIVFQQLRDHHLFLSKSKVDLYSKRLECLGHIIDDRGIHADADKMQCIREWRCPRTFNDVQRFLGLVQYLAHYMPDISAYTMPLSYDVVEVQELLMFVVPVKPFIYVT